MQIPWRARISCPIQNDLFRPNREFRIFASRTRSSAQVAEMHVKTAENVFNFGFDKWTAFLSRVHTTCVLSVRCLTRIFNGDFIIQWDTLLFGWFSKNIIRSVTSLRILTEPCIELGDLEVFIPTRLLFSPLFPRVEDFVPISCWLIFGFISCVWYHSWCMFSVLEVMLEQFNTW